MIETMIIIMVCSTLATFVAFMALFVSDKVLDYLSYRNIRNNARKCPSKGDFNGSSR
jgi:hypothetical protein